MGFTLIELMMAIAVLTILTAIAVPVYQGYMQEAQLGTARANANSLRTFLEDWRLENNTYQVGAAANYDPKATPQLRWTPDGDQDNYTYEVVGATTNNYSVEVTYQPNGRWIRCEDRMNTCCDGTGTIPAACP